MTDQPFAPPKVSPLLDRWAEFAVRRKRVGVKLATNRYERVPTVIQAGQEPPEKTGGEADD